MKIQGSTVRQDIQQESQPVEKCKRQLAYKRHESRMELMMMMMVVPYEHCTHAYSINILSYTHLHTSSLPNIVYPGVARIKPAGKPCSSEEPDFALRHVRTISACDALPAERMTWRAACYMWWCSWWEREGTVTREE